MRCSLTVSVLELLKAYRLEKKKGDLIKVFERVLREYTPCTSISESETLVEYLQNLTLKSSMQNEELRRLTDEAKKAKETHSTALKDAEKNSAKDLEESKLLVTKLE